MIINTSVFDIRGNLVDQLYDGIISNKKMHLLWNGDQHSNGIYIIRTRWTGGSHFQKVTLLK
jgi:hypothetical protein